MYIIMWQETTTSDYTINVNQESDGDWFKEKFHQASKHYALDNKQWTMELNLSNFSPKKSLFQTIFNQNQMQYYKLF